MKILLFGNICSGKTTLLRSIIKTLPFEGLEIDAYRRAYSNGSGEKEREAVEKFMSDIVYGKSQCIECLGMGKVAENLFNRMNANDENVLLIILDVKYTVCKMRLNTRIWDVPFPASHSAVPDLMKRVEEGITSGEIFSKWLLRPNTTVYRWPNNSILEMHVILKEIGKITQNISSNDFKKA